MITTLTVIAALAAGQAASPASTQPTTQVVQNAPAASAPAAAEEPTQPRFRLIAEGAPALEWGVPSRCIDRGPEGLFRAQCDEKARRCYVAPDAELDEDGLGLLPVERAPACVGPALKPADLTSRGYTVVDAFAETPPGWNRDERQRVFQVDFDLNSRFFVGGGLAFASGGTWSGSAVVSAGGRIDKPFDWLGAPALARMHFLEGWAAVDGKQGEGLLFGIDASRVYPTPLFRITTFFGKPRRYDPSIYFGLWAEALRFETVETQTGENYDRTMMIAGAVTVDMWRSRDLSDFVRIRAGAGYEQSLGGEWGSFVPVGALEGELTLGEYGKHHVRMLAQSELLNNSGGDLPVTLVENRGRVTLKAEYEVVLFAVNNQPLSLAFEAKAVQRNDIPDYPTDWVVQGGAQLRFSVGAPPRRSAKAQDAL